MPSAMGHAAFNWSWSSAAAEQLATVTRLLSTTLGSRAFPPICGVTPSISTRLRYFAGQTPLILGLTSTRFDRRSEADRRFRGLFWPKSR